jgi:hypothetical protein
MMVDSGLSRGIVTLYDGQLCRAPLAALAKASDQLDRLPGGGEA